MRRLDEELTAGGQSPQRIKTSPAAILIIGLFRPVDEPVTSWPRPNVSAWAWPCDSHQLSAITRPHSLPCFMQSAIP